MSNTLTKISALRLHGEGPCEEALEWIESLGPDATVADAWARCQRPDWMLWLVRAAGIDIDDHALRVFAIEMRERRYRYWLERSGSEPDQRSEEAIRVAWRYLRGLATQEEVRAAAAAAATFDDANAANAAYDAYAAANDAYDAYDAAYAAAAYDAIAADAADNAADRLRQICPEVTL